MGKKKKVFHSIHEVEKEYFPELIKRRKEEERRKKWDLHPEEAAKEEGKRIAKTIIRHAKKAIRNG